MKEKKYDEVVVETQVLGVKPPQICKKYQNTQKFGYTNKKKKDQKFGDAKKDKKNKRMKNNMHQCWKQLTCYISQ